MDRYTRAIDAFPRPGTFYEQCADCDVEIEPLDPCWYEPDGDMGEDGHMLDCSLWLCDDCGGVRHRELTGETLMERPSYGNLSSMKRGE